MPSKIESQMDKIRAGVLQSAEDLLTGAEEPTATANLSDCETYRYRLTRSWAPKRALVYYILLNPSTANAFEDDPTIRRLMDFAKHFGFGRMVVLNLFAFRAAKPADMRAAADPIGPDNMKIIRLAARIAAACNDRVVCAWGNGGSHKAQGVAVYRALRSEGVEPWCFGTTGQGYPKHPLYLPSRAKLEPWQPPYE